MDNNTMSITEKIERHRRWLNNEVDGERARFPCADLRGADLRGANLRSADLSHANLRGADLRGADLRSADLRGANLSHADLRSADLTCADLTCADLSHANGLPDGIEKMPLRTAILSAISSEGCSLDMQTWHSCETTHCLAGWATTLHPQGKQLEDAMGVNAAAAILFNACEGEVPNFYDNEFGAMVWLRKTAESEPANS